MPGGGTRASAQGSSVWAAVCSIARVSFVGGSRSKSGKTRYVPLSIEAKTVLSSWKDESDSEKLVFPSQVTGSKFDNINKSWRQIVIDANLDDFRFHDLRHTFASKLVMRGVDLNTLRDLLGHRDIKMTLRYAHLAPAHKAAAVAVLDLN